MALTLTITSHQGQSMGDNACVSVDDSGISMGRGKNNDWILPDPERFLSSVHCKLSFEQGQWLLTDTSTNGVFINNSKQRIPRDTSVSVGAGDIICLGDYEIMVAISAQPLPADPDSLTVPERQAMHRPDASPAAPIPSETDIFAVPAPESAPKNENLFSDQPFDAIEAAQPSDPFGDEIPDVDFLGSLGMPSLGSAQHSPDKRLQPEQLPADRDVFIAPQSRTPPAAPIPSESLSQELPEPPQAAPNLPPADRRSTPRNLPPDDAKLQQARPASQGTSPALSHFLSGAGVELGVPAHQEAETLAMFGQLFRQMAQGIMEILMARSSVKSEFRLAQTVIRPTENNPLKFSLGVEEAIASMLVQQGPAYLSGQQAVEQSFKDIKAHQLAVMAGMQAATQHVLARFNPDALEQRIGQSVLDNIVPSARKAKFWDLFNEQYDQIAAEAEEDFQEFFGKEFARAYEEQIKKL